MTLCLIMARGGSRRVNNKNIKPLAGQPLVTWPVRAAVSSGLFQRVIISTDDQTIAQIACAAGAEKPFDRPSELGNDFATMVDVMHHVFNRLKQQDGAVPEYCCILYGTSFLVTAEMLKQGYDCLMRQGVEAVMAVTNYDHPIQRGLMLDEAGVVEYLQPEVIKKSVRTQDLATTYHDVGLFYWVRTKEFMSRQVKSLSELQLYAVPVPRLTSVDIDTPEDWRLAEVIAQYCGLKVP